MPTSRIQRLDSARQTRRTASQMHMCAISEPQQHSIRNKHATAMRARLRTPAQKRRSNGTTPTDVSRNCVINKRTKAGTHPCASSKQKTKKQLLPTFGDDSWKCNIPAAAQVSRLWKYYIFFVFFDFSKIIFCFVSLSFFWQFHLETIHIRKIGSKTLLPMKHGEVTFDMHGKKTGPQIAFLDKIDWLSLLFEGKFQNNAIFH